MIHVWKSVKSFSDRAMWFLLIDGSLFRFLVFSDLEDGKPKCRWRLIGTRHDFDMPNSRYCRSFDDLDVAILWITPAEVEIPNMGKPKTWVFPEEPIDDF